MMHLSRLCEELILWNSPEFGWVIMGDNVTTGSSIMPQKKNPDVAELVRGKTGRVYGNLVQLLTVMKGLPLAYNKDLQEDKESLFDSLDTAIGCVDALRLLLVNTTFRAEQMAAAVRGDFSTATDLADYLVRKGLPFRQAHHVVGNLVKTCEQRGGGLEDLTSADLEAASMLFSGADIGALTDPAGSADSRSSAGGTGRAAVEAQLDQAREHLVRARERHERKNARPKQEQTGAHA
jgi:argininosuccinate lyase